jgi:hypothetical protein
MWKVLFLDDAAGERKALPARDRAAVDHAVEKLQALGLSLGPPHCSAVKEWEDLRELRPQAGKSPWRPLYRLVGEAFVIAAIGPEARKDGRGFNKACQDAIERLAELEDEGEKGLDRDTDDDEASVSGPDGTQGNPNGRDSG